MGIFGKRKKRKAPPICPSAVRKMRSPYPRRDAILPPICPPYLWGRAVPHAPPICPPPSRRRRRAQDAQSLPAPPIRKKKKPHFQNDILIYKILMRENAMYLV
jgi:hypothetical protein